MGYTTPTPVMFYGIDIFKRLEELFSEEERAEIFSDMNAEVYRVPGYDGIEVVQYGDLEQPCAALAVIGTKAEKYSYEQLIEWDYPELPTCIDLHKLCDEREIEFLPRWHSGVQW